MAPTKPRYTDGEKVLCFHGPLLYEAKCLRSQLRDKHMKYFIHYSGWNKNWDEWVPECRVLKYNEANLLKQKELDESLSRPKKPKTIKMVVKKEAEKEVTPPTITPEKTPKQKPEKRPATSPPSDTPKEPSEPKKIKVKIEPCFADEPEFETEVKITIPPILQNWLIDDWDLVNHQKKILHLPARITVDHIIAHYVREKVSVKGLSQDMEVTIVQVTNRIRDTFNILLGKMLLYKFERPHYAEILVEYKELKMCQIYGACHLLRMFTKLGDLLTPVSTPGRIMSALVNQIEDFVRFMAANPNFFSLDDYVVASPEYHRRALG